jgi:nucleoside phosphorylase
MSATIQVRHHKEALDHNYILLLTSNSTERAAVNGIMRNCRNADVGRSTRGCKIGFLGNRLAIHVTGDSGISKLLSIGRVAGTMLSDELLPKPVIVLLVGFCWGNPRKTSNGAVIVSPQILSLNEVREMPGGAERIARSCQSSIELSSSIVQTFQETMASQKISALAGPIGSLETLYQNTEARDLLITQFPELVGAEMEAFGLLPIDAPWLIVKAVSDFGDDDFHREQQRLAACRAATSLLPLITILDDNDRLPQRNTGVGQSLLADLITGNVLEVDVRDLSANGLNDLLNDQIGGPLLHKLGRYVSESEYDTDFPILACALILEVMQNAFKHGRADHATVTLYPTKIVIADDGDTFDPATLEGQNGGARDWRAVEQRYLQNGLVNFIAKSPKTGRGNVYTIALPKATSALREARQHCSMRIASSTIGAQYGRQAVLTFDENCQVLYYRAENLLMTSRRISVADALRRVVESGRKIYVGCQSEHDVVFFKEILKDLLGEKLVVFADAVH